MAKTKIWQCRDRCCADKPFPDRWWYAQREGEAFANAGPDPATAYLIANP